jgi:hypothetical protein
MMMWSFVGGRARKRGEQNVMDPNREFLVAALNFHKLYCQKLLRAVCCLSQLCRSL